MLGKFNTTLIIRIMSLVVCIGLREMIELEHDVSTGRKLNVLMKQVRQDTKAPDSSQASFDEVGGNADSSVDVL